MNVITDAAVTITESALSGNAITVVPSNDMTFPQLTGILVFCIAIAVGCMIANALWRRF